MADRGGLKFVGFIFATVTLAVMLATGMVVKGYADGAYTLEGSTIAEPISHRALTITAESRPMTRLSQRQASASTTTATNSSPANRIMMVPIRCGELLQRYRIGIVRPDGLHGDFPARILAPALGRGPGPASSNCRKVPRATSGAAWRPKPNRRAPGIRRRRRSIEAGPNGNQLLRSPSAARFHCVTLSAIMRVDFIAAWLSWA